VIIVFKKQLKIFI